MSLKTRQMPRNELKATVCNSNVGTLSHIQIILSIKLQRKQIVETYC